MILVLNCGSSTIKFAVINPDTADNVLNGIVQCIGMQEASIQWQCNGDKKKIQSLPNIDYHDAVKRIIELLSSVDHLLDQIMAVGHRVVQGCNYFYESVVIDNDVLRKIEESSRLAPLHNPAHVVGIKAIKEFFPGLPQVAVFDTAFHQTMPKYAYLYAMPYEMCEKHHLRRYGFHGTSYRYVSKQAAILLNKPLDQMALIVAHLGNGCSVTAILNGESRDTSMGLTPLEGLVMGTRSGDVDPSVLGFLADELGYDVHKATNILNKQSGLLGISGISSDMRAIEEAASAGDERAILAEDLFTYRLAKYIMAYLVPLEGRLDALVFTAGIGENSSVIREKVLGWLKMLKFSVDKKRNGEHGRNSNGIITKDESPIAMVVPTNEELMIAQDAKRLV